MSSSAIRCAFFYILQTFIFHSRALIDAPIVLKISTIFSKVRVLTQDLADQELALSSLVEEGVEWSVSEEEEEEEEIAEGWSPSEEEEEEEEEYEEESVDDEEREPEPEFAPGDTK